MTAVTASGSLRLQWGWLPCRRVLTRAAARLRWRELLATAARCAAAPAPTQAVLSLAATSLYGEQNSKRGFTLSIEGVQQASNYR